MVYHYNLEKLQGYGRTDEEIQQLFNILESPEVGVRNMEDMIRLYNC